MESEALDQPADGTADAIVAATTATTATTTATTTTATGPVAIAVAVPVPVTVAGTGGIHGTVRTNACDTTIRRTASSQSNPSTRISAANVATTTHPHHRYSGNISELAGDVTGIRNAEIAAAKKRSADRTETSLNIDEDRRRTSDDTQDDLASVIARITAQSRSSTDSPVHPFFEQPQLSEMAQPNRIGTRRQAVTQEDPVSVVARLSAQSQLSSIPTTRQLVPLEAPNKDHGTGSLLSLNSNYATQHPPATTNATTNASATATATATGHRKRRATKEAARPVKIANQKSPEGTATSRDDEWDDDAPVKGYYRYKDFGSIPENYALFDEAAGRRTSTWTGRYTKLRKDRTWTKPDPAESDLSIRNLRFPSKLYMILGQSRFSHIIKWLPHGRSWRIADTRMFETIVMPAFFEYNNYHSFNRITNAWSFRRLNCGYDRGSYYHELFLRGRPHLQKYMRRLPKDHKKLPMRQQDEPDFHALDAESPLPSLGYVPMPESIRHEVNERMAEYSRSLSELSSSPPSQSVLLPPPPQPLPQSLPPQTGHGMSMVPMKHGLPYAAPPPPLMHAGGPVHPHGFMVFPPPPMFPPQPPRPLTLPGSPSVGQQIAPPVPLPYHPFPHGYAPVHPLYHGAGIAVGAGAVPPVHFNDPSAALYRATFSPLPVLPSPHPHQPVILGPGNAPTTTGAPTNDDVPDGGTDPTSPILRQAGHASRNTARNTSGNTSVDVRVSEHLPITPTVTKPADVNATEVPAHARHERLTSPSTTSRAPPIAVFAMPPGDADLAPYRRMADSLRASLFSTMPLPYPMNRTVPGRGYLPRLPPPVFTEEEPLQERARTPAQGDIPELLPPPPLLPPLPSMGELLEEPSSDEQSQLQPDETSTEATDMHQV